jgi:serine/threonine-protein kinase
VEGTPFGRYRLIDLVGRGGMGEVWRAFDTVTERIVALKVLPTQFADDATFQERFRREARAAAALDEPHIVPIHDFGEIDGKLFVTMRLINGRDLHSILNDGPMDAGRAVGIIDQIASALHAAHRVDLVHRDVKPSNILVTEDDFAYLIDFGIARAAGQRGLTNTMSVIGTWAYMAPERITTADSDARADIYALACVLYECLAGTQPFPGDSLEQQIGGHIAMAPPMVSHRRRDVPEQLDAVITKGMAKNPDERYATTREMALAAKAAVAVAPAPPPPPPPTPLPPTPPTYFNNPYPNQYPERNTQLTGYSANNPTVTPGPPSGVDATQFWPAATGPGQYQPSPPAPNYYPPQPPPQFAPHPQPQRPPQLPTQQMPQLPTQLPPQPPPQYPPVPQDPNRPAPKPSRKGLLIALGSIAAVVAVVLAIVVANSGDNSESTPPVASSSSTTAASSSNAPGNSGPFTGTYTVQFGPTLKWNGEPQPNGAPASTVTWRLSSKCDTNGCVATAAADNQYPSPSLVFDQIGDQWVAVTNSQGKCKDANGELWNAFYLKPAPDGSMSGDFTQSQQNGCLSKRNVSFRRTGDVDLSSLPDPATQGARVPSPASGLRGRYHAVLTIKSAHEFDNGVRTDCLRNGSRCMSYFVDLATGNGTPLVFENGRWTRNTAYDADCTTGGRDHITDNATFPLPQPAPDPIQLLTGNGRIDIAPGGNTKCMGADYSQTFNRIGD